MSIATKINGRQIQYFDVLLIATLVFPLFAFASNQKIKCHRSLASGNKQIILILGPGGTAFDSQHGNVFKKALTRLFGENSVLVIGDGQKPISAKEVNSELVHRQDTHPLIVVNAHGEVNRGSFMINLGNYEPLSQLFKGVEKPVDMFLASCHAGACLTRNIQPRIINQTY